MKSIHNIQEQDPDLALVLLQVYNQGGVLEITSESHFYLIIQELIKQWGRAFLSEKEQEETIYKIVNRGMSPEEIEWLLIEDIRENYKKPPLHVLKGSKTKQRQYKNVVNQRKQEEAVPSFELDEVFAIGEKPDV